MTKQTTMKSGDAQCCLCGKPSQVPVWDLGGGVSAFTIVELETMRSDNAADGKTSWTHSTIGYEVCPECFVAVIIPFFTERKANYYQDLYEYNVEALD